MTKKKRTLIVVLLLLLLVGLVVWLAPAAYRTYVARQPRVLPFDTGVVTQPSRHIIQYKIHTAESIVLFDIGHVRIVYPGEKLHGTVSGLFEVGRPGHESVQSSRRLSVNQQVLTTRTKGTRLTGSFGNLDFELNETTLHLLERKIPVNKEKRIVWLKKDGKSVETIRNLPEPNTQ